MSKEALINIENIQGIIDFKFKIDQVIEENKEDRDDKNEDNIDEDNEIWDNGNINYQGSKASDIKDTWSQDCIKTLLSKNIIKAYKNGTLKPKEFITRGETAVLVGRAF